MTEVKKKVHRVQVDFTENGYAELLKLKEGVGVNTVSEVVQMALRVLRTFKEDKT